MHHNQKLQAMRNKIKNNAPLIITRSKFDILPTTSPSTAAQEPSSSPDSADKQECSSAFHSLGDQDRFYLKNAFEQKYQILEKLGQGGNGVVRKCMDKESLEIFAVKIGKMDEEHMMILERIVNMMKKLKHDSIMTIKQLYRDHKRSKYYHVIEYLPYPSVKQLINQGYQFTPDEIKKIMKQLFSALELFHKHYIVHRDIKTSNLLYDTEKGRLYVIDLGIITKTVFRGKRRNLWSNNGTLEYKAPEMLIGSSYNQCVDIWAAGVVLYQLVQKRTPFKEENHFDIINNITQIKYSFTQQRWNDIPLAKQLVTMLLKPKAQRLNAKQTLKSPWFQQIDWQQMTIRGDSPDSASIKKNKVACSVSLAKPKLVFGSVMVENNKQNEIQFDDSEFQFQGLSIVNPYQLRMSALQPVKVKGNKENKQLLNFAELLGIAEEDTMIVDNNA